MIKVLVLVIIIATVIEVENRKHKVLKHRHKHALRESRPERCRRHLVETRSYKKQVVPWVWDKL